MKALLAQEGFDLRAAAPGTVQQFDAVLGVALEAGKRARRVRRDLTRGELAAIIAGALTA